MKRSITFLDKEKHKFEIEIELQERQDGKEELSMCGDGYGSVGQCSSSIQPANEQQKRLLEIWDKYHLNGMNAGTVKQYTAIKKWRQSGNGSYDYIEKCEYLKSIVDQKDMKRNDEFIHTLLYDYHPETGELYEYGTGWIHCELPDDLWEEILDLCDDIEQIEEELKTSVLVETLYENKDVILEQYNNELIALSIHLELTFDEMLEINDKTYNSIIYEVQGIDYYCGDSDAIDRAEREHVEQTIEECYLPEFPEQFRMYVDMERWIDDWCGNPFENLNGYDGTGDEVLVNDIWYYICRT